MDDETFRRLRAAKSFDTFRAELRATTPDAPSASRVSALVRVLGALEGPVDARLAFLGNVSLDFLPVHLEWRAAFDGLRLTHRVSPFGQYFQEVLGSGELEEFDPDLACLFLSLEDLEPRAARDLGSLGDEGRRELGRRALEHLESWTKAALGRLRGSVLLANFPRPQAPAAGVADSKLDYGEAELFTQLNLGLSRLARREERVSLLDLDRVLARVGAERWRDPKMRYLAKLPWSEEGHRAVADELLRHLRARLGRTRKCLVLDLDNTLWGGVVGEEGPLGVKVGEGDPESEAYRDFQYRVRAIKSRGILLALCSKNNREDALEVFRKRPDMPLGEDDFAAMEINWEPKHLNLERIARRLNIGVDSLVFVDDNPAETSLVETFLPEVEVVLLPDDPAERPASLERLRSFEKPKLLGEDLVKTDRYRAQRERDDHREACGDLEGYLRSLETRLWLRPAGPEDRARVHQLFTKTNQFNLTTIRYSLGDIEGLERSADHDLWIARAADRFGELGTIGLWLLQWGAGEARIDSLILSCRAMGRGIETAMMNEIKARSLERLPDGVIRGRYLPTPKNRPAADFLERQGFRLLAEDSEDGSAWELPVGEAEPLPCDWIERIVPGEGEGS